MASIARKNLFEDIPRFIVAQAGIIFAVSLVTIQVGILNGFTRSTTLLVEESSADLWLVSKDMLHLEATLPLPMDYLLKTRQLEGVDRAEALMIRSTFWRSNAGQVEPVRIYGFNPAGQLFSSWTVLQGNYADLQKPYTAMLDRTNLPKLGLGKVGDTGSVVNVKTTLVAIVENTQAMTSGPYLFTSLETANALGNAGSTSSVNCKVTPEGLDCLNSFEATSDRANASLTLPPPRPLNLTDPISYVLIRAKPSQDLGELKQRLQTTFPDTRVLTNDEMATITRNYWRKRTGVGFVLGLGAAVGVIVGMVVVSQILYSSVSDHIKEFGTLKAMGASDWVIYRVITEQALWMAILGYVPSMALCYGLGSWTMAARGIMILITPTTAATVFVITLVMCVGSALFAIQKVTHVDPAIVFKA